jgi:hypothetical protein
MPEAQVSAANDAVVPQLQAQQDHAARAIRVEQVPVTSPAASWCLAVMAVADRHSSRPAQHPFQQPICCQSHHGNLS